LYHPADSNWWRGTLNGNQLQWSLVSNTAGFGNIWDGRPIWIDRFAGVGGYEILFYSPGDRNWWLGSLQSNQLQWSNIGNTLNFGQVWDGRPFYKGHFSGSSGAEMLFHFPPDQTWWLGQVNSGRLEWSLVALMTAPFAFS
jgi:hypothetical protein